jgi:hypothetical protein
VIQNVQGGLLPPLSLVQLPPLPGAARPFPFCPAPAFNLAHVTPIQADKMRRKTMKIITVALLINAIAELIAAFAKFINAIRHRK